MPPFTFRLEQVRLYRKQLEEQAMQVLARAVMERDAARARLDELERGLADQRALLSRSHSMSAPERWMAGQYENALRLDIAETGNILAKQDEHVDACRADLVEKAKARGLLDSLKEKQANRHQSQERQKEQQCNDETATLRHRPVTV